MFDFRSLRRTSDPTLHPVTRGEACAHCRVDEGVDDALIDGLLVAAVEKLEVDTGRAFLDQQWTMKLDRFPCDEAIDLPRPPLRSVTSITYVDTNGATQTLATDQYVVDTASEPGRITAAYNVSWPSTRCQENAVTIVYRGGYGTAESAVPALAKHAIKLLVGDWYANREPKGRAGEAYYAIARQLRACP